MFFHNIFWMSDNNFYIAFLTIISNLLFLENVLQMVAGRHLVDQKLFSIAFLNITEQRQLSFFK